MGRRWFRTVKLNPRRNSVVLAAVLVLEIAPSDPHLDRETWGLVQGGGEDSNPESALM